MRLDLENLPSDVDLLHRLVRDMAAAVETRDDEITRLNNLIKQLQRARYGRRSERLDPDQMALGLEDLDSDIARMEARHEVAPGIAPGTDPGPGTVSGRRALPDHLPREEVTLDLRGDACPACGGRLHPAGEAVSEMLDWVPAQLRVLRLRRPKYGCRACGTIHQAPAPERPIAKGLATPGLIAQVLVGKYCDHTPLYRQARIFARQGARIERSTLAGWVGGACWWLEPLQARLAAHLFASTKLFAPSTPPAASLRTGLTRRSRCSTPAAAAPRPDGSGSMPGTIARGAGRSRRQRSTSTAPTARPSGLPLISRASRAFCRSTAMRGSRGWPRAGRWSWPPAGRTRDASSLMTICQEMTRPP